LLNEVNFPKVGLSIDEIFDVLDESHVRQFLCKLVDVRAEPKPNDNTIFTRKYLGERVVEESTLLEFNQINQESIFFSTYLEKAGLGLVILSQLRPPFGINSDEFLFQKQFQFRHLLLVSDPVKGH